MKAFHTIAIPHKDILEGRLTMDIFAADLWEVYQNRGPDEYKDRDTFFRKTYLTEGLKNLLSIVEKRLKGEGGDPVIQLQTPFGGGKTHALIAMYHKSREWEANTTVIVGTVLNKEEVLWEVLEKQLTGKVERLSGKVAPGRESIRKLLFENQPVLILMDEVLQYVTRAAGVKVGENNLAAQTIAFMQELMEAAGTLKKVCVVVTLPSSITEHYDESAERLYQKLQKVAGRVEKIYTPVQENEISRIIRKRLFSSLSENDARETVENFMDYAEKEGILPLELDASKYRDRFLDSYPFMPEVIDVLYQRWGSFPTFQRTRGVLRLLSLIVYSLIGTNKAYISLADFNLANQEIRQELIKHIGQEYNGIIDIDITGVNANSKKVDVSLGKAYQGLNLGTRATTTIFLYSFSGGQEHGLTMNEIKRSATTSGNPAGVVAEAAEQLRSKLFYLQNIDDKYFFSNQPNLNRILLTKMENVKENELVSLEQKLLKKSIKGDKLKVFIWEEDSGNIPESKNLKLVILKKENKELMNNILKTKGKIPRVYRNTLFFLYPLESERISFANILKQKIAYEYIERDINLRLSDEQKKEVKKQLKRIESELKEFLRRLYRMLAIPNKDGLKSIDLGIPTYGEEKELDEEIYEKLRSDGEILEKIAPLVIKERYFVNRDYISTQQLYQSFLATPGETRVTNMEVVGQTIIEGVNAGLFGLGEIKDDKPVCRYFKEQSSVAFSGNEIIISEEISQKQKEKEEKRKEPGGYPPPKPGVLSEIGEKKDKEKSGREIKTKDKVQLKFQVPKGKVASIMGAMNLLQSKFETLEIELIAKDGAISEQDYEDKIMETFRQLGIELKEE